MRFGSVCSGIEAASVAWHPLGWKAAWLSEIEPFPSAVLKHHYPDVPNLGDMTLLPERILSGEVEAPDVFCGGTPCQAFSVAGLRNSLDDARGNLSLTFVGIANAIDHVRSVRRDDPAIIFWENVPGVLSTKDNAFGCFLGALAGEDDPILPSGEKWTNAGCVYGPQRTVAWRVLDAQYFGVAQRRRRVFVVASARDDFDPAAVLFEFDGVRRDTAPSREAGKTIAPCVTNGPPFSCTGNERVEAEAMVVQKKQWPQEVAPALDTTLKKYMGLDNQHVNGGCGWFVPDCAPTLRVNRPGEGGMPGDAGQLIPVVANTLNCLQGIQAPDTFNYIVHGTQDPCVSDIAFAQGRNNGGENVLVQPISNALTASLSSTQCPNEDTTLVPIAYTTKMHNTTSNQAGKFYEEYSTSLDANSPPPAVFQPIAFAQNQRDEVRIMQVAGALAAEPGMKQQTYFAQPIDFRNLRFHEGDVAGTMQSKSSGGYSLNYETGVMQPIPLDMRNAGRDPEKHDEMNRQGVGVGEPGDPAHTVTSAFVHAVAQPIAFNHYRTNAAPGELCPTLQVSKGGGTAGAAVAQPMVLMDQGGSVMNVEHDMVGTLRRETHGHEPVVMQPISFGAQMSVPQVDFDLNQTLQAKNPMAVMQSMAVRRLTPVECERLQGFPDNYTNIPWRKKDESPDGPRYKALGNSWAVPVVRWIGKRIQEQINAA
jgi:DNA (cytosine-5)-methyltransferase 1